MVTLHFGPLYLDFAPMGTRGEPAMRKGGLENWDRKQQTGRREGKQGGQLRGGGASVLRRHGGGAGLSVGEQRQRGKNTRTRHPQKWTRPKQPPISVLVDLSS